MSGESLHDSFSANEGGTSAKPIVKKAFGTLGKTTKLAIFIACLLLLLQVMELASSAEGAEEEEEEQIFHFGVFLMILLLCSAMVIGFFLEEHHINWLPEAGAALLLGVVAGLIIKFNQPVLAVEETAGRAAEAAKELTHIAEFDTEFFFLFLLPPIILESGINMDKMQRRKLFQNIGVVCGLAFIGTLVSTMLIAGIIYFSAAAAVPAGAVDCKTPPCGQGMTGLESLIFGSLISATDPVTVLAIFGKAGADRDLYALVFGESVLNDAVAIVLYKTFSMFNPRTCGLEGFPECKYGMAAVFTAVAKFMYIFLGSLFVGCLVACISSLVMKHTTLALHEEFFASECVLLFVFPYMAWMLAESLELSGIVSILFCGFVMSSYTMLNVSDETQKQAPLFFRFAATGCETFVFIYMGLAMFTYNQDFSVTGLTLISIVAMMLSRICNVFPICYLANLRRPSRRAVPSAIQFVVWYSGLRGGIAFALALQASTDFDCRVPTCLCTMETAGCNVVGGDCQHTGCLKWGLYNHTISQTAGEDGVYMASGGTLPCLVNATIETQENIIEAVPCRNMPGNGLLNGTEVSFLQCPCPMEHRGGGPAILTVTLLCVLFTVLGVGGAATFVMTKFGVIGLTKQQADDRQRREEQEDYAIMMAERKKSSTLGFNKRYMQPFLTWKGTNTTRDPLRKAHEAAAIEAARILGTDVTGSGHNQSMSPANYSRSDEPATPPTGSPPEPKYTLPALGLEPSGEAVAVGDTTPI